MEANTMYRLPLLLLLAAGFLVACSNSNGRLHADLDQVVAQGAVSPVDGVTSAGQPDAAALGVFARSGYATVIDMRTAGEDRGLDEPAVVRQLGMEYVTFPVSASDITLAKARELDALLEQYDEPVLLHCGSGNRVGALLALSEYLATGDPEKALQKGRDGGLTGLEDRVVEVIDSSAGP
jgi:uncharacterized protein (TIGR01244 family)